MGEDLEARIRRLERRTRTLSALLGVSMAAFAGVLLMGQRGAPSDGEFGILTVNNLVAKEAVVAKSVGSLGFLCASPEGKQLVSIGGSNGVGEITTFAPSGKRLVYVGAAADRSAGAVGTFAPEDERRVVYIGSTDGGDGAIGTYAPDGKTLIQIGTTEDGEGAIATYNRAGGVRAQWP